MVGSWRLALGCVGVLVVCACGSDSESSPNTDKDASVPDGSGGSSGSGGTSSTDGGSGSGGSGGSSGSAGSSGNSGSAGSGPNVDVSDPQLYELELDPEELDPTVEDSIETQFAQLDTRTKPLGKLVIFLSGATNTPSSWRNHGRKLAEFGFHVVLPHYNNRWSSEGVCDGMGGSCSLDTRWEALVGEDASSAIAISRADSAEGRVVTMLKHLATAHPAGDWGWFLGANDELRYADMIIAGISHGAASTGLYAIRRPFSRAVLHASSAAGSTSEQKQTPLSEWYAFVHTEDPAYDAIVGGWENFEIPGDPTSIDGSSAPYGNSHRLITSEPSSYPHGSVAVHSSSPEDASGNYVFEPAWRYLYGVSP